MSPSDVRLAEAKGARAARRTVGAVTTRLLWWLCDVTPEGRRWRVDAAAVPRAISSPVFVDGDADGSWTAPGPKACDGVW